MRLLSYLARTLPQTENLASEALVFILAKSPTCRHALADFLSHASLTIPRDLTFRVQARDEADTIPDVAGIDENGQERVLIEAKFWAGLTDNQPVEYLNRLSPDVDCLLVFLAPGARQVTLWQELCRRCKDRDIHPDPVDIAGQHWLCGRTAERKYMGITSWRMLLNYLAAEVLKSGGNEVAEDIAQLQDLCDRMDEEAFLPLSSEEFAPQIGRRIVQYCDLVDRVTDILVQQGIADTRNLRTKGTKGTYGRYFRLKGCGCCLAFDSYLWCRQGETPLWLDVVDEQWKRSHLVKKSLDSLFNARPPLAHEFEGRIVIPIHLVLKSERGAVLDDVICQITRVADLLPNRQAEQAAGTDGGPADGFTEVQT
jgi:hypothetical protein